VSFIARLLFRKDPDYEQKRKFRYLLVAVLVGVLFSCLFGVLLYIMNRQGRI
jgi:hypothetical protein